VRTALVIYGTLDTLSGGYLYDRQLVNYLRSQGDEVEIVSLPWRSYPRHLVDNVSAAFFRKLRSLEVDVLLQDELNHPSLFWINQALRRSAAYPLVGVIHHLRAEEEHPRPLMPPYYWVERRYLRTLDAAIYNSETTRRTVAALAGQEIPGVVALPAADHLQPPSPEQIEVLFKARGECPTPLRLLSVGTLIRRKGIDHLLRGLALLPPRSWQLAVVGATDGDPGYVAFLRRLMAELQIHEQVTLYGRLPDAALVELFCRSHALALLSYEGFGIAFLEAMSFGLPILAANTGAAPEVVEGGSTGFLVEAARSDAVAERLRCWLQDPSLLATMGQAARRRFDLHPTWNQSGKRSRDFLLSIARG
jgi:glycosyltransferase involved in cell wall biosynthesis